MNVALYMRYSSDKQTEQSIEGQERVCREFCDREGYTIVAKYIDRATSAFKQTDRRTEFQRMIRESARREYDAVIVYKLDRFARNRYDSATYKAKLKQNGVRVISATESLSDNPEGIILESVLEGMAEFYSAELSQKVSRGMRETALKANSCGGTIPLGYRVENKKLVVDPITAPAVVEAFHLYAEGVRKTEIIKTLNDKGYRTATGSPFNKNSFHKMFKNERYIGTFTYNGMRIENAMPAIIDIETWNRVQDRLKKNKDSAASGKAKVEYLLTGKMFCGHCGSKMVGHSGHGRSGETYHYYGCMGRLRDHTCDKHHVSKQQIEDAVVQDTFKLLTPENMELIADAAVKACNEQMEQESIVPQLTSELKAVEKKIGNLLTLAENGVDLDILSEKLQSLAEEKKNISNRIDKLTAEMFVIEKPHVLWWLKKFSEGSVDDINFRRNLIDLLVRRVTVWDEPDGSKITIEYNLTSSGSHTESLGAPRKRGNFFGNYLVFACLRVILQRKH